MGKSKEEWSTERGRRRGKMEREKDEGSKMREERDE